MRFPDEVTNQQKYGPAMQIQDEAEAAAYFEACVEHNMRRTGKTRAEAEKIEKSNLGYFAGYYDNATRLRVERVFHCVHPYFGSAEHPVTWEEAFAIGIAVGQKWARDKSSGARGPRRSASSSRRSGGRH